MSKKRSGCSRPQFGGRSNRQQSKSKSLQKYVPKPQLVFHTTDKGSAQIVELPEPKTRKSLWRRILHKLLDFEYN